MNQRDDLTRDVPVWLVRIRFHWRRFARRLSPYSSVTSMLSGAMLAVMLIDLAMDHTHFPPLVNLIVIGSYALLTALPLVFGRRYPAWAGLVSVAYLIAWNVHLIVTANDNHVMVGSVLQLPLLGFYLGWFWQRWASQSALLLSVAAIAIACWRFTTIETVNIHPTIIIGYAALFSWFTLEAGSVVRRRAEWQAAHDLLTGVFNRRGLTRIGSRLVSRSRSRNTPLSLAVIDFDDFKGVNDSLGHAAGDAALREVADLWVDGLDPGDLVARTGGDEFVVMSQIEKDALDERLRELRKTSRYSWTYGLCQLQATDTLDSLLARADESLYAAKKG